ncbi:MAG: hypothetical protein IH621_01145 [Krumholzibacteria bacterium]|nr:hypothetical protein [Candidatus Krumholzibacteria bacterium]
MSDSCPACPAVLAAEPELVTGLAAAWVGWVVIRTTVGMCEPAVLVHGPVAFPAEGRQPYPFFDPNDQPGLAYE